VSGPGTGGRGGRCWLKVVAATIIDKITAGAVAASFDQTDFLPEAQAQKLAFGGLVANHGIGALRHPEKAIQPISPMFAAITKKLTMDYQTTIFHEGMRPPLI